MSSILSLGLTATSNLASLTEVLKVSLQRPSMISCAARRGAKPAFKHLKHKRPHTDTDTDTHRGTHTHMHRLYPRSMCSNTSLP